MPQHKKEDQLTPEQALSELIDFIDANPHVTKFNQAVKQWGKYTRQHMHNMGITAKHEDIADALEANREEFVNEICLDWIEDAKAYPALRIAALKIHLLKEDELKRLNVDYVQPRKADFQSLIKKVARPKDPAKN